MSPHKPQSQYRLQDDLAESLGRVVGLLDAVGLGAEKLYLGGGTALATMWGHRAPTDIDLFFAPDESVHHNRRRATMRRLADIARPPDESLEPAWSSATGAHGYVGDIPFSLAVQSSFSAHVVRPTLEQFPRIKVATAREIIEGKMLRRWPALAGLARRVRNPVNTPIPSRDLYDIAVCNVMDPDALEEIVADLSDYRAHFLSALLLEMPSDIEKVDDPARLVEAPSHRVEMVGLAHRIAAAIDERDLGKMPEAVPIDKRKGFFERWLSR